MTLKMKLSTALILSLCVNAWMIGFNAPYMKERARLYAIDRLETAALDLRKNPIKAAADDSMPVKLSMDDLKRVDARMQHKADVIAMILEGSEK